MTTTTTNRKTEIRTLVDQVQELLQPMVDDTSISWRCGHFIRTLLELIIVYPLFIILISIWVPFALVVDSWVPGNPTYHYIFVIPTTFVLDGIIVISHPLNARRMLSNADMVRNHAQALLKDQTDTLFLIPIDVFKTWTSFPQHEEVKHQLVVKKITDLHTFGLGIGETLFISHKWLDNQPDTPNHEIYRLVRKRLREEPFVKFLWFDFVCVPQSQQALEEHNKQLLAIANIMQRCEVRAFHVNEAHKQSYERSVWCQLEAMAINGSRHHISGVFGAENLTMFDEEDLYAVLPAFIDMVFSRRYQLDFIDQQARIKIFLKILAYFIKYHDETSSGGMSNKNNRGVTSSNGSNMQGSSNNNNV
jgi:hypothetical protein